MSKRYLPYPAMGHLHWGKTTVLLGEAQPVPYFDAIKSFTESAIYTVSSWWYGLRDQSVFQDSKNETFPRRKELDSQN